MESINNKFSKQNVSFDNIGSRKEINTDNKKRKQNKKAEVSSLQALSSYNKASISFKGDNKEEYNKKFQKLADKFGKLYADGSKNVSLLMSNINEYNIDFIEKLAFGEDENGNPLFAQKNLISEILIRTTEDNLPFFEKLCLGRDEDGNDLFPEKKRIPEILWYINKGNIAFAEKLCLGRDKNGNDIFPEKYKIPDMLSAIQEGNIALADKLYFGLDEKGDALFSDKDRIWYILWRTNEGNNSLAEKLCLGRDEDGNDLFPQKDKIPEILRYTTKGNIAFAEKLCIGRDKDGNDIFSEKYKIPEMLEVTSEENITLADKLYFGRDDNGNDLFSQKDLINSILQYTTKDNITFAETFCFGFDESGNDLFSQKDKIPNMVKVINGYNFVLANKLYFGRDENGEVLFSQKDLINSILQYTTKDNIDLAEKLCFYRDDNGNDLFSQKDLINSILQYTTKDNIDLAEKLCFGRDDNGNDLFSQKDLINSILQYTTKDNIDLAEKLCLGSDKNGKDYLPLKSIISELLDSFESQEKIENLINLCKTEELSYILIPSILRGEIEYDIKKYRMLQKFFKENDLNKLSSKDAGIVYSIASLCNKNNINEIDLVHKKEALKNIISKNTELFSCSDELKKMFPLLPENQEQYCALVSSLAKSIGIETNEITKEENEIFNRSLKQLSLSLAKMSDNEFNDLEFNQEYSKDDFIKNVFNLVKDMNPKERQKVYDYFGFELKENRHGVKVADDVDTRYSIVGYPVNLNNGKKLAQIEDEETKRIVEKLRSEVIRFSENNNVTCLDKTIEQAINEILEICPEIRTEIGKTQHDTHEFDVFKHSLKVMQKIVQNPQFEKLNDSDKKIMLLASMLHDITKTEGTKDVMHAIESAFDGFYISKKFDLTHDEEIKLYSLMKNHEWLGYVNSNSDEKQLEQKEKLKSVAYDLQYDNLFEMAKIFTEADLKAVKKDDRFFDKHKKTLEEKSQSIQSYINELKATQPFLPVTKIPSSSRIKQAITRVNPDHSTNLAGIYKDENGMIVIRYNEVENETWEKIGFDKGTISKGVKTFNYENQDINTGNIKFYAHGLDEMWELQNFDAFRLPDSDALLSVSYMELPESKYRLFRSQGVLLNTDTKYEHGGGDSDGGSGTKKVLKAFKKDYAYHGSKRYRDRTYVSDLIKEKLVMTDEEYIEFVKVNENKAISEIEPKEYRRKLIEIFATINSNIRSGNREYNEMYITNPEVMGVFAYSQQDYVGNTMDFISQQKDFLKQYALDNDIPFVIFGN